MWVNSYAIRRNGTLGTYEVVVTEMVAEGRLVIDVVASCTSFQAALKALSLLYGDKT